ncbi:MAG: histone deacetylase [Leptospiraceae bacterium]|nr:histone deacetylase [Leptospiraceae bacterium]MDW7976191.1 histone deacetylase [Leptospiraceae bacterium]
MSSRIPLPLFVYSKKYNFHLEGHVFPAIKYSLIYEKLISDPRFSKHKFYEPTYATVEQLQLVHDKEYIDDLRFVRFSKRVYRSELPFTREIIDVFFLATGGTILASELALEHGRAINLSGGFHHAFSDHAEGFCYLNDVAIAIRYLQKQNKIKKALVIDLDVHQGNGTAKIFEKDRNNVFTFSMHEEKNYPIKEKSSLDIPLETGIKDQEYLSLLEKGLDYIKRRFTPDIIFYVAGVDPYEMDRLGGLSLTKEGLKKRDIMVRDFMHGIPLVTVLAGGYAINTQDTVDLHFQTAEVMANFY